MFAAHLLILGGSLGLGVEALRMVGTVQDNLPPGILESYPHWLSAVLAGLMLVLGVVCLRTQAAVFGYAGAATGFFSLAYAGLVPFLSLLAVLMLIKSRLEGEETRNDGVTLPANAWPDKAMGASLFMVVGGAVVLWQGVLIGLDRYEPVLLKALPAVAMAIDVAVGLFAVWAAGQVYHLRRPWVGDTAAALLVATFGLYVLGPVLGLVTFLLMQRARREDEFRKHASAAGAPPAATRRVGKAG